MQNDRLIDTVIKNDYCIGCGACSFVDEQFKVGLDQYGMIKASQVEGMAYKDDELALAVCPFSNSTKNEDFLAEKHFGEVEKSNPFIGKYIQNYVGYVEEGDFREKGSSGGFGKWILNELLEIGEVDYVIQVVSNNERNKLFTFQIFQKGDDLLEGSKSAYYPITLKDSLEFIKDNEGKYAITAVPCFGKAIRNLCLQDAVLADRIKYVVGIICGHLKSTGFAESLAWQLEVHPQELLGIEFRGKIEGLRANEKGVYALDQNMDQSKTKSSKTLYGGNWGWGFFKYKACDYCDDVVGETTDVSVGDAWIEELMQDHRGNNVIVIRNEKIAQIVNQAIQDKRLNFQEVKDEVVVQSQLGGIKHRREGLSYRLYNKKRRKEWVPEKRVQASNSLPYQRKRIYNTREIIRDASHRNFKKARELNSFSYFVKSMDPLIKKLGPSLATKIKYTLISMLKKYIR